MTAGEGGTQTVATSVGEDSFAAESVSLENCEREPIHVPGAIQPHGVLFACRGRELVVEHVSENVRAHLGIAPEDARGASLERLLDAGSWSRLERAKVAPSLREINPLRIVARTGASFDAVLSRSGDVFLVELEPAADPKTDAPTTFDPRLRASVVRLQSAGLSNLATVAAEEVRTITGFDRVMVYRFDADWNGTVVAESKRADLEPFLGLHYPASDIPAQARRLYTVNWLRFIVDVGYVPSRLIPARDPKNGAPLDLSHSVLRSVSPIHIEYLRNMGVTASMSISLVVDGVLTGLIACHHYSGPRLVPFAVRETCEYLGQTLSWHLRVLEVAEAKNAAARAHQHEAEVVRRMAAAGDLLDGLATPTLLSLADATGAAVVLEDGTRTIGAAPGALRIARLCEWLSGIEEEVFVTDHLAARMPEAEATAWEDVAGVLAVAISRPLREYILWFRPAVERTVDWAGDPRKVVIGGEDGAPPRLSPRGSFALWRETVRGRSVPWETWQIEAASNVRRALLGGVRKRAAELRSLNQRLTAADRAKDNFITTVSHELRTPLNAITGWARLLQSGGLPAERERHAFDVIARNATAQTRLIEDLLDISRITSGKLSLEVETVDIVEIVEAGIEAVALACEAKGIALNRLLDTSTGPVLADPTRLRQIVSNLLTNAVKFTPKGGKIEVVLQRARSDIELCVTDTGQGIDPAFLPHVFESFRQQDEGMNRRSQGLGLGLAIVRKLVELHGGMVNVRSEGLGKGAAFVVRLPMSPVRAGSEATGPSAPLGAEASLAGLKVLVVEDEPDSRELVGQVLRQAGATVVEVASAPEALMLTDQTPFDAIVSDIGLPDMDGFQFLRELRTRSSERGGRTPAVALTAYTRAYDRTTALQAGFHSHVPKPVDAQELIAVLVSILGRW